MRLLLGFAVALVVGCGDTGVKTVPVGGTVLKGGKALSFSAQNLPPGESGFRLEFLRQEDGGKSGELFAADFKSEDGTFSVKASGRNGIPPGKYKVIVEKGARGRPDEFKNSFSKAQTPLLITVPDTGNVQVEIDLDKKAATVK